MARSNFLTNALKIDFSVRIGHVAADGKLLAWKSERSTPVPSNQEDPRQVSARRWIGKGNDAASLHVDVIFDSFQIQRNLANLIADIHVKL